MTTMTDFVQSRAEQLCTSMPGYYKWFYNDWLPHIGKGVPSADRNSWPVDTYKADIALLAWLQTEMARQLSNPSP